MTAASLIVQSRIGKAFLLTDTGVYEPDGTVARFESKIVSIRIAGAHAAALTATGMTSTTTFARHLARRRFAAAAELVAALPEIFRDVEDDLIGGRAAAASRQLVTSLAVFDADRGEAAGYIIGNVPNLLPGTGYRPRTLQAVRKHLTPFAGTPFRPGTDLCDPRQWNPERDAAALIEAQRMDPFDDGAGSYYGVGGRGMLTCVDATGLSQQVVKRWPDRVGERIDPARRSLMDRIAARWNSHLPSWAAKRLTSQAIGSASRTATTIVTSATPHQPLRSIP